MSAFFSSSRRATGLVSARISALCGLVLATNLGCPDCPPPVAVVFLEAACETSPCSDYVSVPNPGVRLEYSKDGGERRPCGMNTCAAEHSGGCGGSANGRYEVFATYDNGVEVSDTVAVRDYSCTDGGGQVEFFVGELPPFPRCAPTAEPSTAVAGSATWGLEGWSSGIDVQMAEDGDLVQSTIELSLTGEGGDEVVAEERIRIARNEIDRALTVNIRLGDLRDATVGETFVVGMADDFAFDVSFFHECVAEINCLTIDDVDGVTVEVLEVEGGPAPYPAIVTDDYRIRYRLSFDRADVVAAAADTSDGCATCDAPLSLAFDLTFERTASDFAVVEDADCRIDPEAN